MAPPDEIRTLLAIPPPEADPREWLQTAARNLDGYRPQALVIRRSLRSGKRQAEARRWSRHLYLPLAPAGDGGRLMLRRDGWLEVCRLDGIRRLRNRPGDTIRDEIYAFHPVPHPQPAQLEAVRRALLLRLYPQAYRSWRFLGRRERLALVEFGGGRAEALAALASVQGRERVETLALLLSPQAQAGLRREVLEAGLEGEVRPGAECLPWLLSRSDWNLQPALVAMARCAVEDEPEAAWHLRRHPNPRIRLRLVDLLASRPAGSAPGSWVDWLAVESREEVRERILRAVERDHTPAELVEELLAEGDPVRREALGWVLVHWNPGVLGRRDWEALNRALFSGLGADNRARLREKLASHRRLSLKGRLLG